MIRYSSEVTMLIRISSSDVRIVKLSRSYMLRARDGGRSERSLFARSVTDGAPTCCSPRSRTCFGRATVERIAPVFVVNGPVRTALDINCSAGAPGRRRGQRDDRPRAPPDLGRRRRRLAPASSACRRSAIRPATRAASGDTKRRAAGSRCTSSTASLPATARSRRSPASRLQIVNDTKSRGAADLLTTIARSLQVVAHHKARSLGDARVVVGPEHVRTIANDGWSKGRVRQFLWEQRRSGARSAAGRNGGDGLPERTLASYADAANDTTLIPKFRALDIPSWLSRRRPAGSPRSSPGRNPFSDSVIR